MAKQIIKPVKETDEVIIALKYWNDNLLKEYDRLLCGRALDQYSETKQASDVVKAKMVRIEEFISLARLLGNHDNTVKELTKNNYKKSYELAS